MEPQKILKSDSGSHPGLDLFNRVQSRVDLQISSDHPYNPSKSSYCRQKQAECGNTLPKRAQQLIGWADGIETSGPGSAVSCIRTLP